MEYLDSNVFIFAALDNGSKGETARKILHNIVKGMVVITSTLTIDEIIWAMWKETKDRENSIEQGLRILEFPNLRVLPVNPGDVHSAINLMKKYQRLQPRDAIHLAVSIHAGVFRIVSDDSDFDNIPEIERKGL